MLLGQKLQFTLTKVHSVLESFAFCLIVPNQCVLHIGNYINNLLMGTANKMAALLVTSDLPQVKFILY